MLVCRTILAQDLLDPHRPEFVKIVDFGIALRYADPRNGANPPLDETDTDRQQPSVVHA